ncbi:MAG: altronate dehydratase [Planctomycetes bacterium]|nr:altronate dehydratase [Planctomycetota bacterium]
MENFTDYALLLHDRDDVAVMKRPVSRGMKLVSGSASVVVSQSIPRGHKLAIRSIPKGNPVRKYGQIIGFASQDIGAGSHVHSHNLEARNFGRDYEFCVDARSVDYVPPEQMRTFRGYLRPDARVGTRNYVAIISTVNCSASVSRYAAERFRGPELKRDFPNVDGVLALTHKTGCAMPLDEPTKVLQRVLAGFARHPNVFGYLIIGLGCECNQVPVLVQNHGLNVLRPGEPGPAFLTIQEVGGVVKTVEAAVDAVRKLLPLANEARRSHQPISKLVLAEECGGSDAASGITANPALGLASDELVRFGGTSILSETPEVYGAEHLLTRRAVSRQVGEKLIEFIHWWEDYTRRNNATIDNNPAPGNKEGGLTTIYEKSLGAVAKGGQSPLAAVYRYAESIHTPGFGFMDTPGYDPVSMTGMVAGGCNIAAFTTGRGSVYGCKPVPCIKIATNTPLYERMADDMDINAGDILDGSATLRDVGLRILEKIIAVAGGERTRSELHGMGDEEFAPWQLGPTL